MNAQTLFTSRPRTSDQLVLRVRLNKSRNARSEQVFMMLTELLTNREWLLGELLSGLER